VENAVFSLDQACADAELEAACRSTEPEETELHLRLALFYLERRRASRFKSIPAPKIPVAGPPICHTDKEG
jgi:hypothetical protein